MTALADRDGRRLGAVYAAFGLPATWTPAGGSPVELTVIAESGTGGRLSEWGGAATPLRRNVEAHVYRVRDSEVAPSGAKPRKGDRLVVQVRAGETHTLTLTGVARREDARRHEWTVEAG